MRNKTQQQINGVMVLESIYRETNDGYKKNRYIKSQCII